MKRTVITILTLALSLFTFTETMAWGRGPHAAIVYIAECNLTPKAKANIEACIDNHSIVYYASWLDYYRSAHKAWNKRGHVSTYDLETCKPIGKSINNLTETISLLRNYRDLTDSARKFNIYALLHTLGDYHCPGHVTYVDAKTKAKTGSGRMVNYLGKGKAVSYHKVWDGLVASDNHPDWGYMEYEEVLDRIPQEEKDRIVAGTPRDWLRETAELSRFIYETVPEAPKGAPIEDLPVVTRDMMNEFGDFACDQILKGGLRLAKVINDIFGQ